MIQIQLNGEAYELELELPVSALLGRLKMKPMRVAVEINRSVVPKAEFDRVRVHGGDQVEIISFVGGG